VKFQADRTATNVLQLAGYAVLRFTWTDVTRRSAVVARMVRAALR
jgi:very-short-patch-repair endonuclease